MKLSNPEYEASFIGCILTDNSILEEYDIGDKLFSDPFHITAMENIRKLKLAGAVVSGKELADTMKDNWAKAYELGNVSSAANVKFYYDELSHLAIRRGALKMAQEVAEMAANSGVTTDAIFNFIDQSTFSIASTKDVGYRQVAHVMADAIKEIEAAYKNKGKLSGVPTGFPKLDEMTNGWQKSELIVLGARASAGKTAAALCMSSAALRANIPVGFFSAEMSATAIVKRMIADWGTVNTQRMRSGLLATRDFDGIMAAAQGIAETSLYINDTPNIALTTLCAEARKMKRKEKVGIIFVDYLTLIGTDDSQGEQWERVGKMSKKLKGLARELEIPIVVLSQLAREAEGCRPNKAQLRASGSIEEDADVLILLWNQGYVDPNAENKEVKITAIVEKQRNGPTGDIPMLMRPAFMRFEEVERAWEAAQVKKRRE